MGSTHDIQAEQNRVTTEIAQMEARRTVIEGLIASHWQADYRILVSEYTTLGGRLAAANRRSRLLGKAHDE